MTESATPPLKPEDARPSRARRRYLGEMLCGQRVITRQQLNDVLELQKKEKGPRIGRLLLDLGYATEAQISEVVAEQLQIPAADLLAVDIPKEVLGLVTRELATKYVSLPWFVDGRELYLIMADPTNVAAADAIAFSTRLEVRPVVAPESEILMAIQRFYSVEEESLARFGNIDLAEPLPVMTEVREEAAEDEYLEKASQDRAKVALDDLGFEPDMLATFKEMLHRPQGMILVTGPAGSGKTSTLYAALNFLRSETTNIVTVEDPVAYQIRDGETAQIAFQAAQTGHLVLATLHTNDAPSAVTRLVEMGVPAYLVASSVIAVQAQRLVRRLCECKTVNPDGTAQPKGCEVCRNSGFKGRLAIYELLRVTPRVRSVLLARGSDDLVRRAGRVTGMRTMFMDGERKVARGITVREELLRVIPPDESEDGGTEAEVDAANAPLPAIPAPLSREVRRVRRTKILVVEDEENMLEVLREVLAAEEYDVVTAGDGREARAQVYKEAPDLILTDLQLPLMDGLELVEKVRGDLSTRHIPVIFLTGIQSKDSEIQAYNLGADDYLTKPFQPNLLLSRIRRSLFRAHLRDGG